MGCVYSKSSAIEDTMEKDDVDVGSMLNEEIEKVDRRVAKVRGVNQRGLGIVAKVVEGEHVAVSDEKVTLVDKKMDRPERLSNDQIERRRRRRTPQVGGVSFTSISSVPKAAKGEQIAAGWPSWLSEVAGEALKGWVPRRADTFEKIDKIGEGTYGIVYKGRDTLTGKFVALKKVRFDNLEPESVKFMAREILILRRLDHPNVVKLEGLVTSRMSCSLYLVFEYMEHDLTGLISLFGTKFTQPQIKCYIHQLFSGLDHCHSRGVLHRDVKSSNILIDDQGTLKIADFGLASFFDPHQSHPMTSRVTTLWYRPPELLLGATTYGVGVDLWSTGCILGELLTCRPIMPGRTEVEQLHKIFKLCGSPSEEFWKKSKLPHSTLFKPQQPYKRCVSETFKDFPAAAMGLMEILLSIDPAHRGTAARALNSEFFKAEPHACDLASLPKYPPSKEIDAELGDEEARRPRAPGRSRRVEPESQGSKESRAIPAPNANAELSSLQQYRRSTAKNFHFPAPLLVSSNNVDQMLEEHDRQIREVVKRACLDKARLGKVHTQGTYDHGSTVNKIPIPGPPLVSSNNVDQMLEKHDLQIQEAVRRARLNKAGLGKVQAQGMDSQTVQRGVTAMEESSSRDLETSNGGFKNKRQSHSKSQSQKFNSHKEEAASGFPSDPTRKLQAINGVNKDLMDHHEGVITSETLFEGLGSAKARKNIGNSSRFPTRSGSLTITASNENPGSSSHRKETKSTGRVWGFFNDWESTRKQDHKYPRWMISSVRQMDSGRTCASEFTMGRGAAGDRTSFSGVFKCPSNSVDRILMEHDRHIQEFTQRTRRDKMIRLGKFQAQGSGGVGCVNYDSA